MVGTDERGKVMNEGNALISKGRIPWPTHSVEGSVNIHRAQQIKSAGRPKPTTRLETKSERKTPHGKDCNR